MGSIPYADASGTGVTFRVWAPNATTVAVRGNFNSGSWNNTSNYLVKEAGTQNWSKDVPNLKASDSNQYKYYINGSIWKMDPRSRKVVNSSDNSIIYDPNAFNWGGDARLTVTNSSLVIYEMHVGAFYDPNSGHPGTFTNAITKLDYLASLGVNAVELLPIAEFPTDYSWGYNPSDPDAVENSGYGGPDGLKSFVKAAHQRGLRVLLDVVHNHYGSGDLDMYSFDVGTTPGVYFYTASNICCTPWGPRPNYSSPGVRSYIIDNISQWLDEYHVDGFRWDSVGTMRYYDPGHVSIPDADSLLQYINSTIIHSNHPGAISIAEDQSSGMDFDGEWDTSYGDTLISTMTTSADANRDMNALQGAMDGTGFSRVVYSETHDLVGALNGSGAQRLPVRIQASSPTGFFARKRSMLAAAIVMCTPGVPMLFMGQEMLITNQFSESTPLDWTRPIANTNIVTYYHDLIRLRRNLDGVSLGMTGPNISWHTIDDTAKLLSFHRWGAGPNDQVMVVLNCSNTSMTNYSMSGFPVSGPWYVNLNSDSTKYSSDFGNRGSTVVNVTGGTGSVSIGPYSVLILSKKSLSDLTATLRFTSVQNTNGNVVLNWQGGQSHTQIVQQASALDGAWTPIFTNLPPTTISNSLVVPMVPGSAQYFRIYAGP